MTRKPTDLTESIRENARPAGLFYLGVIASGLIAEAGLRGGLIDWTDATATAGALGANLLRFRLSMAADMLMAVCDVALAVLLYRMLRPVDRTLALMAMVFRLVQMAIVSGNIMVLIELEQALASGADVLALLRRHAAGYDLGLVFFGITMLLTAQLLCRSGAMSRALVAGLGLSGLVYLAGSLTRVLAPDINAALQPAYLLPLLAETAFCIWLLRARAGAGARAPAPRSRPQPG